ncbi:MAG: hypothetical protein MJZ22_03705 [Candidatus Saccharibacteria bacterium]|nr:hypothetical protein [Candidatus Saccharibacteria bacterium]
MLADEKQVYTVVVLSKDEKVLYGSPDRGAPQYKVEYGDGDGPLMVVPGVDVQTQYPNRTDAIAYQGGQFLSNGGFEDPSMTGWIRDFGDATNVRGNTAQGSRYLKLNGQITQILPHSAMDILADSGAVLTLWHKEVACGTDGITNSPFLRSKCPLSTPKFAITLQRFFIPRWLCCAFWGKLLISDKN